IAAAVPVPDRPPPAFRMELAVDARAYAGAALVTAQGEAPLPEERGWLRAALAPAGVAREGSFLLSAAPREPAIQAGFAESAGLPGTELHARVRPRVRWREGLATGPAIFVFDTSLSQRTRLAASCGRLLREVLERDASLDRFRVVTFDVAARPLFDG